MRSHEPSAPGFQGGPRRRLRYRPQVLPTLLTLGNFWCGYLAIAKATDAMALPRLADKTMDPEVFSLLAYAGWMIFLGMVFDGLDGRVARISGGSSALGAQLDSLADLVTFGIAPAILAKSIAEGPGGMLDHRMTLNFSVFFAAMAALRLARYNTQHGDPEEAQLWFVGLPSPGAAAVIASLAILLTDPNIRPEGALLRFLPWATLVLGLLMVSRLPYSHATNRFLRGRKPVHYLVIGMAALVLVLALASNPAAALAAIVGLYALSGPVTWLFRRGGRGPGAPAATTGIPAEKAEKKEPGR